LYALGALVAFGFGVALWSTGDVANACDTTTGQGCPPTPSTQPLPGSPGGPPAAQGPSVRRPNNQVQPGSDNGGPFIPPGAGAGTVPTTTPAPPQTTVAPVTPSPVSTSASSSSGGPNWVEVGAGGLVAGVGAGLMYKGWNPVKNLDIGVEITYSQLYKRDAEDWYVNSVRDQMKAHHDPKYEPRDNGIWSGIFRRQRNFEP
jgi:hypothetical protein